MDWFSLTDAQWEKMKPFGLGKSTDPGRTGGDARLFVEAVLWIARTGSLWRDLRASFGRWNTVFKRFRDWVKADVFTRMFNVEAVCRFGTALPKSLTNASWPAHGSGYARPRTGSGRSIHASTIPSKAWMVGRHRP